MIAPKTWPERFEMIHRMETGDPPMRIPHTTCTPNKGGKCYESNKLAQYGHRCQMPLRVIHNTHRQQLWVVKL